MAGARVTVERRPNPATANVMAPIDEALARASQEAAPIPISTPPPPADSALALARGLKKGALPTASEVGRARFDESDASGPHRAAEVRTRATAPKGDTTSRDLRWGESEAGEERPSQVGHVPQGVFSTRNETPSVGAARPGIPQPVAGRVRPPRSAFTAESKPFFPAVGAAPAPKKDDATRPVNDAIAKAKEDATAAKGSAPGIAAKGSAPGTAAKDSAPGMGSPRREAPPSRPPAPRKHTLVMGASSAPPSRPPIGPGQPIAPPRHATTIAMGSVDPAPPEAHDTTSAKGPRPPRPATIVGLAPPAKDLETISASVETDATSIESEPALRGAETTPPERKTEPLDLDAPPPLPPAPPRPRVRTPLFGEERAAAPDAPPLPKPAFHAAPDAPHDPPKAKAPPPAPPAETAAPPAETAAPPAEAPHADEPPIGALAATPSFAPPPAISGPRPDPTPLGVVVPPTPPSGVATSRPPPPAPAVGAGRSIAWTLVGLGVLACVGVTGWIAYARQDDLRGAIGMGTPAPTAVSLVDAAVAAATDAAPPALDAGAAALAAEADAYVDGADAGEAVDTGVDAYVDEDAWAAPAEAEVDAAVAPPPSDVVAEAPTGDLTADQLVEQAAELPDPQAETLYRRALNLDARNHYAAIGLAEILMRRGAAAEAIPYIETAIRRRGRRAEYRVMLGDARRDSGDAAGAQRAWREALEIDPDDRDAHQRLGE
jgi:hypothetical protein